MYNIHGWWEWENGTVNVIEFPLSIHETAVGAIIRQISTATAGVFGTNQDLLYFGSTSKYLAFFYFEYFSITNNL